MRVCGPHPRCLWGGSTSLQRSKGQLAGCGLISCTFARLQLSGVTPLVGLPLILDAYCAMREVARTAGSACSPVMARACRELNAATFLASPVERFWGSDERATVDRSCMRCNFWKCAHKKDLQKSLRQIANSECYTLRRGGYGGGASSHGRPSNTGRRGHRPSAAVSTVRRGPRPAP